MKREIQPIAVNRTVVGYPEQLEVALRTAYEAGRLVSWGRPRPLAPGSRRVAVDVELLEQPQPPAATVARPWHVMTVAAGVALGAQVMFGWALWLAVVWVGAHLVPILITAATVVLGVVGFLAWLAGSGKCPGLHCGGCRG